MRGDNFAKIESGKIAFVPKYDVIILAIGDPFTALINRYYTVEFFKELKQIFNPDGIFSFSVSSSENYLNEANRKFLRTINSTLKEVFVDVKSIPGDQHLFLASSGNRNIGCQRRKVI